MKVACCAIRYYMYLDIVEPASPHFSLCRTESELAPVPVPVPDNSSCRFTNAIGIFPPESQQLVN